ncbi:UNVERIFIED_CONTAM: hypothetical protein HDU68_004957 [Siphonaria sp. JEL0065]|nr:hypothetical protein HDU68_004957 [Siphonaria sp. JEL0065]
MTTTPYVYPEVRRDDTVDILHGLSVSDPYRHLEDPDAPETKAFVEAQGTLFQNFIKDSDIRGKLESRLTEMFNYERYGVPFKKGDNYYYFHNSGLQPQSVLYTQKTVDGEASVFFDPNTLSADGTVSLGSYSFSESGNLFGYALSSSGSDWVKLHVRKVGSDKDLEDKPLEWAKFTGIKFSHDEKGFFYNRYPAPSVSLDKAGTETDRSLNQMVCYHRIGTDQSEDIVVYKDEVHPERMGYVTISDCGRYLILSIRQSTDPKNLVYLADLEKQFGSNSVVGVPEFTEVVGEWNANYQFIASEGSVLYFQTTLNASKTRIVKYDVNAQHKTVATKTTTTKTTTVKTNASASIKKETTVKTVYDINNAPGFVEVIPEAETPLDFVNVVDGNKIVLVYLKDVKHVMKVHDLTTGGFLNDIEMPEGSIIKGMSGNKVNL